MKFKKWYITVVVLLAMIYFGVCGQTEAVRTVGWSIASFIFGFCVACACVYALVVDRNRKTDALFEKEANAALDELSGLVQK